MTSSTATPRAHHTPLAIRDWKSANRGIAVVTAYDALFARLADHAGADAILVGDSLGPAILAIPESEVTLRDMVHHGAAVRRGLQHASLILDVPPRVAAQPPRRAATALARAAVRVGAAAVKIEGAGLHELAVIRAVLDAGVVVVGHLSRQHGEGSTLRSAAASLARLGVPAIVLVDVPLDLAEEITASEPAATISVRSGSSCDGSLANALELAGLAPSPHGDAAASEAARGAQRTAAEIASFCAGARMARKLPRTERLRHQPL